MQMLCPPDAPTLHACTTTFNEQSRGARKRTDNWNVLHKERLPNLHYTAQHEMSELQQAKAVRSSRTSSREFKAHVPHNDAPVRGSAL